MSESAKYRKKPVVIEAMQYDGSNSTALAEFCNALLEADDGELFIDTLEGDMHVSLNDWIIKGVQGEFYPCKPDIFAATYESVTPMTEPTDTVPEPDVDSIRKRADAATPGPWKADDDGCVWVPELATLPDDGTLAHMMIDRDWGRDAAFIAAARTDIPALLDALATAREEAAANEKYAKEGWAWLGAALEALDVPSVFDIPTWKDRLRVAQYKDAEEAAQAAEAIGETSPFRELEATITQLRGELSRKDEALVRIDKMRYPENWRTVGILSDAPNIARAELSSGVTINGVPQTWEMLYEVTKTERDKYLKHAEMLYDLDRCEHGRHMGDDCGSCGGPSHGNLTARDGVLGHDMAGRPILVRQWERAALSTVAPDTEGNDVSVIQPPT